MKHNKDTDTYTLELTVYPLDTLETVYDEIVQYIETFNAHVEEGDYNNTTEVDYETEFAEGIIEILKNTTASPGYMDPVVLEIPIQPSDDYYFINDEDFLSIDKNILYIREDPSSADDTEGTDSEEESEDTTTSEYEFEQTGETDEQITSTELSISSTEAAQ